MTSRPLLPARSRPFRRWPLWAAAAVGGTLLLTGCAPWRLATSAQLAREAIPFNASPTQPERRVLVVGDSTAVGTGADRPIDSLPGRLGQAHPRWRIDNLAANGARFEDVVQQLGGADAGYDLVLVLAGGNDVIRLTGSERLRTAIDDTLTLARQKGAAVVVMPCGDVGHAPFFLPPLSWWMSQRSSQLHSLVRQATANHRALYVSLLRPRGQDPFVLHSKEFNAADGLHPSSAGYAQWYSELVAQKGLASLTR